MEQQDDKIWKSAASCELCGSRKNLEIHHIVPQCFSKIIYDVDLDSEDNKILVCSNCHARLTPKSILTKCGIGIQKAINMSYVEELQKNEEELSFKIYAWLTYHDTRLHYEDLDDIIHDITHGFPSAEQFHELEQMLC